jgi:hypothetical protein
MLIVNDEVRTEISNNFTNNLAAYGLSPECISQGHRVEAKVINVSRDPLTAGGDDM